MQRPELPLSERAVIFGLLVFIECPLNVTMRKIGYHFDKKVDGEALGKKQAELAKGN